EVLVGKPVADAIAAMMEKHRPKPPEGDQEEKARPAAEVIREFFELQYKPAFRRRTSIVSRDGEEISRPDACQTPTTKALAMLSLATDAPRLPKSEVVDIDKLPGFFKKWAPVAWGDIITKLPDEDEADLGAVGEIAAEEFRNLLRS